MPSKYAAPELEYDHVIDELDAISRAATKLLAPNAGQICKAAIEYLRESRLADGPFTWEIPRTKPIATATCKGQYHPNNKGQYDLEGRLSFIWDLRAEKRGKKKSPAKTFSLIGKVSTKIEIHGKKRNSNEPSAVLGSWRFEMGDEKSPGVYFHNQIDWPEHSGIDIPRLPSMLLSPAECLDFLLGEMFQTEWPQVQLSNQQQLNRWSRNHRSRLCNLLEATSRAIRDSNGVSPWIALKQWQPVDAGFLEK